ncbi:hypothetical protein HB364_25585 [Pseudoflavitalea sp. X16]|uniref:hypothetical protein n=1 Tax=Paraflavitalea devenefica TaxID=2716334 RepID=UPI00141EA047|nr:hypothetical protein [Paraflavitalea devenefica]NII28481.1 hypothetical protein [Paraflavitalea devenefica]
MKTINVPVAMVIFLLTMVPFYACKKGSSNKPACRIITTTSISDAESFDYNYSYNAEDKLASVTYKNRVRTFSYSSNTAIVNETLSGSFSYKRMITLNSNGLVSNVKMEKNLSGTEWENTVYEYSGTQLIKITTTKSTGGTPSVETFEWANGNLVKHQYSGNTTTYEYHTDKPSGDGDFFHHLQYANYGFFFIKTKNLVKSFSNPTYIATLDHSFDNASKISSVKVTYHYSTPVTATFNHQYQCN